LLLLLLLLLLMMMMMVMVMVLGVAGIVVLVVGDLVGGASGPGAVHRRVHAAAHRGLRAGHVLEHLVAHYRGDRVHAHTRAVLAVGGARDRVQEAWGTGAEIFIGSLLPPSVINDYEAYWQRGC
jgi:hypothetical protein